MFALVGPAFLLGANLPWVQYGEFGANAWQPRGGLSRRADLARVAEHLAGLRRHGMTAVRWFLLCDGRAGIRFDGLGVPVGCDDAVWRDLETAFALSTAAGLGVVPVLFDFLWCARRRVFRGVQMGGRAAAIRDPASRTALVERVIDPLLERYGREPGVLAWDVMNEPEWATRGVGTWRPWHSVSGSEMRAFIGATVERIHARTRHLATVGSASARWLPFVTGLGLDVYQPHWYDHLERRAPLTGAVAALGLDRPAWLGEFPTRGCRHSAAEVCDLARRAGYAGAFAWSLLSTDPSSGLAEVAAELGRWADANLGATGRVPDAADATTSSGVAHPSGAPERQGHTS